MKKLALLLPLLVLASCGGGDKIEISGYGYSEDKAFNLSQAKAALEDPGFEKIYGSLQDVYIKGIVTQSYLNDPSGDGVWAGTVIIKEEGKATGDTVEVSFFGISEDAKSNYDKYASRLFDFSPCSMAGYEVTFKGSFGPTILSKSKYKMYDAELISFSRGVVETVDKPNLLKTNYNFQYVPSYFKADAKTEEKVKTLIKDGASLKVVTDREGDVVLSVEQYLEHQDYFSKVVITMNTPLVPEISYTYRLNKSDYEDRPYVNLPYENYQSVIEFKEGACEIHIKILFGDENILPWNIGFELIEKD